MNRILLFNLILLSSVILLWSCKNTKDFEDLNWGMSRGQVVRQIKRNPDTIQDNFFVYTKLNIKNFYYDKGLKFDDGKLSSVNYLYKSYNDTFDIINKPGYLFSFWKDSLTKVYGKPTQNDINYSNEGLQIDSNNANYLSWMKKNTKIEVIQRMDGILISAEAKNLK